MQLFAHVTGHSHEHAGLLSGFQPEIAVMVFVALLLVFAKWFQVKKR